MLNLDTVFFGKKYPVRIMVPALNYRPYPEIARVKFSTRTNLPGGVGGPGGVF